MCCPQLLCCRLCWCWCLLCVRRPLCPTTIVNTTVADTDTAVADTAVAVLIFILIAPTSVSSAIIHTIIIINGAVSCSDL